MTPTVSVIVTSYNYGRYVGAALESVRAQTMDDYEVIILDDGSTDDSLRAIGRFLDDPRFRLIRQKHTGQPRTKNRGLAEAQAPLIAFLDADDLWAPTKLARQVARLEAEPALGVVCTRRKIIDADGRSRPCFDAPPPQGWVVDQMFRQNFICFSSAMLRAGVAEHVGGFDASIPVAIDYDFWLRAARFYQVGVVAEPLVSYRVGHGNLSSRQFDRLHVARLIMDRFVGHYDSPAVLTEPARRRAEVETLTHLGVIARGSSRRASLGWLTRALRTDARHLPAWRALLAASVPGWCRRWVRAARGKSGDWERHCYTPANRPEPVL